MPKGPVIGELLGHYRVLSQVGEGGMGTVYRAHDEVLHRDVALKALSDDVIERLGKDHLLQEARASSALNHPNICTVYEIVEVGDALYIAMELVEGKTLSELIGAAGLPIESVLRYGAQIASALGHAHGRRIIHHDLKSSNIVVTPEGLVKVLDFGLARRMPADVPDAQTMTFSTPSGPREVSGTLSYMAPEVLRGEEGDARSDLWALGVVLYEAAAGQLPFRGKTGFETTSAILKDMPAPLPPHVPPGLWSIVQKCLAKEPGQRYQQVSEVKAALEAVESGAMTGAQPTGQPAGITVTVIRGLRHLRVGQGDVLLLVGTMKGAFLLRSTRRRSGWDVAGPYFHGNAIYAMGYDGRADRHRLWASTSNFWGTLLRSSDDFGRSWTNPLEANVKFPTDTGTSLKNIWQLSTSRHDDQLMYCGVEPAALFESRNAGESWSLVRGLFDHPHRPRWVPGNGGLALHTILEDPVNAQRVYVAISAGGVYRTDDGGATWKAANRGIRVTFQPEQYPEFGQCVHKMVQHPSHPERLFLQHHWGLYRSDDCAESWRDIGGGVPSDFGFPMVVHPHDPDCVYIVPIESDEFRCAPDGRLRVFRTRNGGGSWEALSKGLPQKGAYETVLRDALSTDPLDPVGIYFGTRSGQLFGSSDEGKSWKRILGGLPSIVCVKTAVVGDPSPKVRPASAKASAGKPARKLKKKRSTRGR
jgi:serine/threonine protein kinase